MNEELKTILAIDELVPLLNSRDLNGVLLAVDIAKNNFSEEELNELRSKLLRLPIQEYKMRMWLKSYSHKNTIYYTHSLHDSLIYL